MATTEFKNAISRRVAPPKLLVGESTTVPTSARAVAVTDDGAVKVSLDGGTVSIDSANLNVRLKADEAVAANSDSVVVAGTTDGAIDGPEHAIKVGADGTVQVAGAVTVAGVATEATLALVKTAVEKVATETAVGDGLMVRSDTAANMLVTEASAAAILGKLDAATSTLATQATLATRASEATLATRASEATVATLATQATAATIATNTLSAIRGAAQYMSAAAEACASVKATAGVINSGAVYNQGGALAYLQFHDLAAAPAGGAVPSFVLGEIAAGDTVPWPCSIQGATGLQAALSSTRDTYTAYANGRFLLWRD